MTRPLNNCLLTTCMIVVAAGCSTSAPTSSTSNAVPTRDEAPRAIRRDAKGFDSPSQGHNGSGAQ